MKSKNKKKIKKYLIALYFFSFRSLKRHTKHGSNKNNIIDLASKKSNLRENKNKKQTNENNLKI